MVIGYASQNPYSIYGKSEYQQQQEEKKKMLEAQYRDFVPRKSKKENVGAEIDMILKDEERRSAKAREQEMGGQDVWMMRDCGLLVHSTMLHSGSFTAYDSWDAQNANSRTRLG